MEAVDVLGDYCSQFSTLFQLCQSIVGFVGFCFRVEHHMAEKLIEFFRMALKIMVGKHFLIGNPLLFLHVKSMSTAEIGNAAGGGNPCPAKKMVFPLSSIQVFSCFTASIHNASLSYILQNQLHRAVVAAHHLGQNTAVFNPVFQAFVRQK